MNTCANLAGGIAPISTAYLATRFGWITALDFAALVSFCGGLIWVFVNADDNVEVGSEGRPSSTRYSASVTRVQPVAGAKASS
jgi:sugar phosphate permease